MSRETRIERRMIATATRALLVERFPAAFMPPHTDKRPLAVGIYKAIRAACPDIPCRDLNFAMRDYTGGPKYLRALIVGADRIGLDGAPVAQVSETQATHAAARLAALKARWAKRKPAPAAEQPTTGETP